MLFHFLVLFSFVRAISWCHVILHSCIIFIFRSLHLVSHCFTFLYCFICNSLHQVSCCFLFLYYFYFQRLSSGVILFSIPVLFLFLGAFIWCHVVLYSCIIFISRSLLDSLLHVCHHRWTSHVLFGSLPRTVHDRRRHRGLETLPSVTRSV